MSNQNIAELLKQAKFTLGAETLLRSFSVQKLPCDKTHILVACFQKSGSTWLTEILGQFPDFHKVELVPIFDRREQELTFEKLLVFHGLNYVAQHHCRFSEATQRCLNAFSIKPVILIRNIFDCVVSTKDHIDGGQKDPNRKVMPMAYVPEAYYRWSDSEKFEFIIDLIVPWYFNFFVGWHDFDGGKWLSYEALLENPSAAIKSIFDYVGLKVDDAKINRALELASQQPTRRNVAKIGRGDILSNEQKDRIYKFASYYPLRDFSPIGL